MKKLTMQLEPLVCPTCAQKIETALNRTAGVATAAVLYNSSRARVEYREEETAPETLAEVVRNLGYEVRKLI